jgi:hypothetical protein
MTRQDYVSGGLQRNSNSNLRRRGTDDATLNSSIVAQADWEFCHRMWTAGEDVGSLNGVEGSSQSMLSNSMATTPLRMDIACVLMLSDEGRG